MPPDEGRDIMDFRDGMALDGANPASSPDGRDERDDHAGEVVWDRSSIVINCKT